jgi:protein SCO1/2
MSERRNIFPLIIAMLMLALPPSARALPGELGGSSQQPAPAEMQGITIDEKSGQPIPLDIPFIEETGKTTTLRQYFHKDRPVLVQLSYFGCPMLCSLVSQGMVDSLNDLTLTMGKDFEVINISFDPSETSKLAAEKKKTFLDAYNRPTGAESWHFLTGSSDSIKQITDATGFRYKWIQASKQFSHPAALILLTPDGKISRYLYGVKYDPKTLRLSLVEASQGKIGNTVDRILLTCFHYDSYAGKYTMTAMTIMRAGGIISVIVIFGTLFGLVRRELRHRKRLVVAT